MGTEWDAFHLHCETLQGRVITSKLLEGNGQCPRLTPILRTVWHWWSGWAENVPGGIMVI